jgi:hypothetical protein
LSYEGHNLDQLITVLERDSLTLIDWLRDRPFNLQGGLWLFVSFRNFFSDNTRVRIYIFFVRQSAKFFFQNSTLGYMTKTRNQIIFFSSTKIRIFFSATLGIRIFFLGKKHNPLQVKWSFPYRKPNGSKSRQISSDSNWKKY